MSAQYYASPRVHDDELIPNLLAEMRRISESQTELRDLVEQVSRTGAAAPGAEGAGTAAGYDPAEAAVGRAMVVAERHADAVRQAAEEEAKQKIDTALQEAEQLEAAAQAKREEAEREIAALTEAAEQEKQRLLSEAEAAGEAARAQARAEADAAIESALQEAERLESGAREKRAEAQAAIDAMNAAANEEKERLLAEAQQAGESIRAEAVAAKEAILEDARHRATEVAEAAEVALQARLAELMDEISRTELRLESLRERKEHFERDLSARVRALSDLLAPEPDELGLPAALMTNGGGASRANGIAVAAP